MTDTIEASFLFARALAAGGIRFVTAFPGSPTTRLGLVLERHGPALGIEFRWAINENVALSQAFGSAMAGRGAAALMKHVGVNVASDALHAMGVVHGLAAPLLLVEGADAKPGSSQSAQDNRSLYASSPQLLVVSPTAHDEIASEVRAACSISTAAGMLVVLRGDARCFGRRHVVNADSDSDSDSKPEPAAEPIESSSPAWPKRGFALATSARTYGFHLEQRRRVFEQLSPWIEHSWRAHDCESPRSTCLVIAAHLGAETAELARARGLPYLRLLLEHPLPEAKLCALARNFETLVVLEECAPILERQIAALMHRAGLTTQVTGRAQLGDARPVGRVEGSRLEGMLDTLAGGLDPSSSPPEPPGPPRADPRALLEALPAQLEAERLAHDEAQPPSGFPAADPRRRLFAHLRSLAPETFISVDPGVTGVLALADHQCDVKMHMGGAVPIAAGWSRARTNSPTSLAVAVVGDTNLPHSEWLGLLDAAHHGDDLLVVIADNGMSEMTQRIVTPRLSPERALASFEAAGFQCWRTRASETDDWLEVLSNSAALSGPRLVWLDLPSA